eukprot:TRINITY_DN9263_c0_g1_i5.p1 TRINITY_DN9263_c0_g1~~TRINITY_DN9263_c0_g1_i5.p1  ORF type:complete len:388 (+),score=134.14 TRINITY_DN9263_c0_g1_i5:80-1243(+)
MCIRDSHYVILARAFFDMYSANTKAEGSFPEYLERVKELCRVVGLPLKDEKQAEEFFVTAKGMWETKLLGIYEDEGNKELLETLKKVVALELGAFNEAIGLNFYDVYEQLVNLNVEVYLDDYVNECRELFGRQWKEDYQMKNLALEYFTYNKWAIETLDKESLEKHVASRGVIGLTKHFCSRMVNLAMKQYLKLYEALIGECNDESMAESTKSRGIVCHRLWNFDKLKKFNAYTLAALQNCGASIKKTFTALHLDVPLEFAKTNTLRLLNFGSVVVKKLKEGVIVVYNKAARTVTVVVECVKDPKKVKKAIARILGSVKCTVVGCYLVFDYDADGWVSMKDIGNSILKLLSLLKNADYLGGAEALYMKAISCLKSQKKEEPVTTVTE